MLTVRVGLWKSLSGDQVHDGRSARWQLESFNNTQVFLLLFKLCPHGG